MVYCLQTNAIIDIFGTSCYQQSIIIKCQYVFRFYKALIIACFNTISPCIVIYVYLFCQCRFSQNINKQLLIGNFNIAMSHWWCSILSILDIQFKIVRETYIRWYIKAIQPQHSSNLSKCTKRTSLIGGYGDKLKDLIGSNWMTAFTIR